MKTILTLLFVGSLAALGGAFFEMWTIPKLENLPTISNYAKKSTDLEERASGQMDKGAEDAPPGGPLAPKSDGRRQQQLNQAREQLAP